MAFKVFISHSVKDISLVKQLQYWLDRNQIEAYIFEEYPQPGTMIGEKVARAIDRSDCVLALMTRDGSRSQWVHNEVGYAKGKEKIVIPIVENGVINGGFLEGVEYIPFRIYDPYDTISRTVQYLSTLKSAKKEQEQRNKVLLAGLMVFFGLLALSGENE